MAANEVNIDDVFGGIKEAKGMLQANYVKPGHYIMVVRKIKLDRNRKKKVFLATEMTVLTVVDNAEGKGHRAGEDISHLIMEEWDGFLGDCKKEFSVLLGVEEDEIDLAACKLICGSAQPCENVIVEVKSRNKTTNSDKDFTVVNYARLLSEEDAMAEVGVEVLKRYHVEGEAWLDAEESEEETE